MHLSDRLTLFNSEHADLKLLFEFGNFADQVFHRVFERSGRCLLSIRLDLDIHHTEKSEISSFMHFSHFDVDIVLQRMRLSISGEDDMVILQQLPKDGAPRHLDVTFGRGQARLHSYQVSESVGFPFHDERRRIGDLVIFDALDPAPTGGRWTEMEVRQKSDFCLPSGRTNFSNRSGRFIVERQRSVRAPDRRSADSHIMNRIRNMMTTTIQPRVMEISWHGIDLVVV